MNCFEKFACHGPICAEENSSFALPTLWELSMNSCVCALYSMPAQDLPKQELQFRTAIHMHEGNLVTALRACQITQLRDSPIALNW